MKLIVSSYNKEGNKAVTLFNVSNNYSNYEELDSLYLYEPSFLINYNEYIFTYTKNPLKVLCYTLKNNKFVLVDSIDVPLDTLTHLAFNDRNNTLYGASYKDGSIISVKFNNKFSDLKVMKLGGKCHCVVLNKEKNKVGIINIEKDTFDIFDNDLNLLNTLYLPKGVGPRHGLWINNDIYLITEYSNEIIHIKDNDIKYIDRISSLNSNVKSYGATILIDDNYLYGSNRGEETICIIDYKDNLKYVSNIKVYGLHSRHMIFDNTKENIISFNKNSNNICIINIKTGKLLLEIPYNNVSSGCIYV